jgi:molybdate transport system substrate-binding protein
VKNLWLRIVLLAGLFCASTRGADDAHKTDLSVFAAASLTESFKELGKQFEEKHPGVSVAFNFGATNALRTQLEHGASADVFASANTREMDLAIKAGLLAADAPRTFARNRLVLLIPKTNRAKIEALKDLARPGIKLVIAHKAVPVGKYTLEMLDKLSADKSYGETFKETVLKNVVSEEENVKSVVSKVRLDQADAGIAYASDVGAAAAEVVSLAIPETVNPTATYPVAALSKAPQAALAKEFIELLLSASGQEVIQKHGFLPAEQK